MTYGKSVAAAALSLMLTGTAWAQAPKPSASLVPPADAPPVKPTPPGPYAVTVEANPALPKHTIYRPTDMAKFTGKNQLPVIAWGNGACSNAGLLFENFLTEIASYGYVIVASGPKDAPLPAFARRPAGAAPIPAPPAASPGNGAPIPPPMTKDEDLQTALNWAVAETAHKGSPYEGKLDPAKIAVMGQSCGGLQAVFNSADPRVKTSIIWNSGTFPDNGQPAGASMSGAKKASLAKIHAPIAYFSGGPQDVAQANAEDDFKRIEGVPVFWGWIYSGHGGTYDQPGGGRFGEVGIAWLNWHLKGDAKAARMFEGPDCTLCKDPIWHVSKKNMK